MECRKLVVVMTEREIDSPPSSRANRRLARLNGRKGGASSTTGADAGTVRDALPAEAPLPEQRLQLLECLALDLSYPFASNVEGLPHLVESAGSVVLQAETEFDHAALPIRQLLERVPDPSVHIRG